jgi:hypothetical protein
MGETVPLSEHEQRILAELEESLVRQDPRFAERVRSETLYRHAGRQLRWAVLGFLVGLAVLVVFFSESVVVGFVGVALMFVCAVVFERNLRRMGKAGWHDLTRNPREEGASPGGVAGAVHGLRAWMRSRFSRRHH